MKQTYPLWAEVDLAAVAHNVRELKNITRSTTGVMAVVKADGYGHGAVAVARVALESGATSLAVARVGEGLELRRAGIKAPVLVFGLAPPEDARQALQHGLTLSVYSRESALAVAGAARAAGKKAVVHVKVDTGMGRLGFPWDETGLEEVAEACSHPELQVEGIYTHFAAADEGDKTYTLLQLERFKRFVQELARRGLHFKIRHAANSAALIDLPEAHLDVVRPGIALYGLYPSAEVDRSRVRLRPAMTLKTRVVQVREVGSGYSVSYGCTYRTPAPTVLATLAAGYADGYSRLLSSRGYVLLRGKRAPVVGRVCMDQCMVDAGHVEGVKPGDEVVLLGSQGNETVSAEEIAAWMGTINYEVVTSISARVPRVYLPYSPA